MPRLKLVFSSFNQLVSVTKLDKRYENIYFLYTVNPVRRASEEQRLNQTILLESSDSRREMAAGGSESVAAGRQELCRFVSTGW